ncbi:hypothetical protein BDZ97DRAFT_1247527 [Flammula alnicola]|nr:hypothetical protein BDZ97DRAFT_1247527 [Flammula alnicola]
MDRISAYKLQNVCPGRGSVVLDVRLGMYRLDSSMMAQSLLALRLNPVCMLPFCTSPVEWMNERVAMRQYTSTNVVCLSRPHGYLRWPRTHQYSPCSSKPKDQLFRKVRFKIEPENKSGSIFLAFHLLHILRPSSKNFQGEDIKTLIEGYCICYGYLWTARPSQPSICQSDSIPAFRQRWMRPDVHVDPLGRQWGIPKPLSFILRVWSVPKLSTSDLRRLLHTSIFLGLKLIVPLLSFFVRNSSSFSGCGRIAAMLKIPRRWTKLSIGWGNILRKPY